MCMRSASRANSGGEELNLERRQRLPAWGEKDRLAVSVIGDGAEPRQTAHRWVGGTLHVLTSEKPRPDFWSRCDCEALACLRTVCGPWGHTHFSDVTDHATLIANLGRAMATGGRSVGA